MTNNERLAQERGQQSSLLHGSLTERIIGTFYDVYNELGVGYLESVYESAMFVALTDRGLAVNRQHPVTVHFRRRLVGQFRADLIVERSVVVELKACKMVKPIHEAQVVNYLRASHLEVGLLLNFGQEPEFRRLFYTNDRKGSRLAWSEVVSPTDCTQSTTD